MVAENGGGEGRDSGDGGEGVLRQIRLTVGRMAVGSSSGGVWSGEEGDGTDGDVGV